MTAKEQIPRATGRQERNSELLEKPCGVDMPRREFLGLAGSAFFLQATGRLLAAPRISDRIVVLSFDDAVKTQRTFVAPLLKDLGFGATFFVCHRWMTDDPEHYMTWQEIAEIHQMGFEIGNHSWTHADFSSPRSAARLPAELVLVERELKKVSVPRPKSFAWCGNAFGPEGIRQLAGWGYNLARRGMQPEVPYGMVKVGPTFDPQECDPLLIPTTGDNYPGWTLEHFRDVASQARTGQIVVFQFHGVPDPHPWVNCPPENFREYMGFLKEKNFQVIAFGDLQKYLPTEIQVSDPLLTERFPEHNDVSLVLPVEMETTRAELRYWLENMIRFHHYTWDEIASVTGLDIYALKNLAGKQGLEESSQPEVNKTGKTVSVLPYPGGRHPRIGFLDGAICPMRGTKASVFLPWDPSSYVVVDLPEAIFSNLGLTFLAHTDVPTIWDARNIWLENIDWDRGADGSLSETRRLPNRLSFGASIKPSDGQIEMEVWLRNDTAEKLTGLRAQICAMLKGAEEFNSQTNDNKLFRCPACAVKSSNSNRWILMAWDRCVHAWGNPACPCMHADPTLADCAPGETVRARGRIWFYEGADIDGEMERASQFWKAIPSNP